MLLMDPRVSPQVHDNGVVKAAWYSSLLCYQILFMDRRVNEIFDQFVVIYLTNLSLPEIRRRIVEFMVRLRHAELSSGSVFISDCQTRTQTQAWTELPGFQVS